MFAEFWQGFALSVTPIDVHLHGVSLSRGWLVALLSEWKGATIRGALVHRSPCSCICGSDTARV